jgi:hypothetical protein
MADRMSVQPLAPPAGGGGPPPWAGDATPGEQLAHVLEMAMPTVNVYPSMASQVKAPAVVLVPDDPWFVVGPAFGAFAEHWLAIACVPAADPRSGMDSLHGMLLRIEEVLPPAWALRDIGRPVLDESLGSPMLAAAARLTYR